MFNVAKRFMSVLLVFSLFFGVLAIQPVSAKTKYVAEFSIVSDGSKANRTSSSKLGSHSWISVKNISKKNISVGAFKGIKPNTSITVGTWGNQDEHDGIWYNLDAYLIKKKGVYKERVSYTRKITAKQLEKLNSALVDKKYNEWKPNVNCAHFAEIMYGKIFGEGIIQLAPKKIMGAYAISHHSRNPKELSKAIKGMKGYKKNASFPVYYNVHYVKGGKLVKSKEFK